MIFKQIDEIVNGLKTQTRRVAAPEPDGTNTFLCEMLSYDNGLPTVVISHPAEMRWRIKWQVGRTYAVVPGRGRSAVWWRIHNGKPQLSPMPAVEWRPGYVPGEPADWEDLRRIDHRESLHKQGYRALHIRITAIRREKLQAITEADAHAEGVSSVGEYAKLWDRINKRKGTRWSDNPDVWVISFEVIGGSHERPAS